MDLRNAIQKQAAKVAGSDNGQRVMVPEGAPGAGQFVYQAPPGGWDKIGQMTCRYCGNKIGDSATVVRNSFGAVRPGDMADHFDCWVEAHEDDDY